MLRAAGLWIGLIVVCAALNYAPSVFAYAREGTPIIVREKVPAESEVYGLKIRQLVSPVFEHTFGPFRAWTRKEAAAQFPVDTET